MENKVLFREAQRFKTWWIWFLLLGVSVIVIYTAGRDIYRGEGIGKFGPIFALTTNGLLIALFLIMKLETEVRPDGIYVRFHPFHRRFRCYPWRNLTEAYVREYSAIFEYGGWGLRGLGNNRALNVSGNKGIQLVTKRGDKLLIGTRKPKEAAAAIENYFTPSTYA